MVGRLKETWINFFRRGRPVVLVAEEDVSKKMHPLSAENTDPAFWRDLRDRQGIPALKYERVLYYGYGGDGVRRYGSRAFIVEANVNGKLRRYLASGAVYLGLEETEVVAMSDNFEVLKFDIKGVTEILGMSEGCPRAFTCIRDEDLEAKLAAFW